MLSILCNIQIKAMKNLKKHEKHSNHEKQAILSMISNGEGWRYLAVKKYQHYFLRGITSKHDGDFYCLDRLLSFRTKYRLEQHKKVCGIKGFLVL